MREQPSGCLRLFFSSTVFDYILCRISENIVESGRFFLGSPAKKVGFFFNLYFLPKTDAKAVTEAKASLLAAVHSPIPMTSNQVFTILTIGEHSNELRHKAER